MEKLIELLNEYAPEDFNWCAIGGKIYDKEYTENSIPVNVEMGVYIISKQFGFIQWLVEQDKIDFVKLDDNSDWYDINTESEYLDILALLSIQDNPIEFLCEILK